MEGYPRCQGIWDAPGGGGFCIFLPHPQKSPRDSQRVGRQGELPFKASGTNGVSREGAKVCSGVGSPSGTSVLSAREQPEATPTPNRPEASGSSQVAGCRVAWVSPSF